MKVKQTVLSLTLMMSLLCFSQGLSAGSVDEFKDVATDQWYYNAVAHAVDEELFCGTGADTFSPNTAMSRAMFTTVLGRFDCDGGTLPPGGASARSFNDVDKNAYYTPYITWAAENGLVNGTGNDRFEPNRALTREEMTVMLARYAHYAGITSFPALGGLDDFDDSDDVAAFAEESFGWCVAQGLLRGNGANRLDPKTFVSRAQAAQIFYSLNGCFFRFDPDKTEQITVTDQNSGTVTTIEGAEKIKSCLEKLNTLSFTAKDFGEPSDGDRAVLRLTIGGRAQPETIVFRNEDVILYRGYAYTAADALSTLFPNWPEVSMNSAIFNLNQISRVTVRNGTTGQLQEITNDHELREILRIFNEFPYETERDTEQADGWSYRLTLYGSDDAVLADCIFLNDSEVSCDGKTYSATKEHYFAPLWQIMAK